MKPFKEAEEYGADLQAAYDYYKAYGSKAAARFLAAYKRAEGIVRQSPFVCRARGHGWRQMIIEDYPSYSIFYKELSSCWLLGGVIPTVRDPDLIQARLLIREVSDEK